jgi:hypothetical protein
MKLSKLSTTLGVTTILVTAQIFALLNSKLKVAQAHCPLNDPLHCASHLDPTPYILPGEFSEEAWGEAGRGLYRAAANFMARDNSRIPRQSLDSRQKELLRPEFGSLVDKITVQYGADMMDRWGSGQFQISQGSDGQTFCNRIYIQDSYRQNDYDQLILLAHELQHSRQCENLGGMSNFGYRYFKEFKKAGQNYANNALEREAENVEGRVEKYVVAQSQRPSSGEMILSNKNTSLAINAWDGAQHGTVLRLHNNCVSSNPDCTWTYRNRMLISDKDPSLAINAWEGAQHGTVLRLHNKCVPTNPDCTWTYRNGMFVSDRDPSLVINAWEGAQHGTVLRLHNSCVPSNPDCTWSLR